MPRLLRVPCRSSGRHSALMSGPFPRQVPPLVLVSVFVAGVSAVLPRPPRARRAAVGCGWVRRHRPPAAVPPGRGLLPRVAARVGPPGPWAAGRPPGWRCVADPGRGLGWGPGGRETKVLPVVPVVWSVGRGAAGAPTRRAWRPVGPPCRTLPKPGGLGPRWDRGCGAARRRRSGRWWRRSG